MFVLFVMQSYLIEVRGLKHEKGKRIYGTGRSYLIEVRGLKQRKKGECTLIPVVPYRGTWVETLSALERALYLCVVPYRGTWVETDKFDEADALAESYLIEVRGLKPILNKAILFEKASYLIEVRGLKQLDGSARSVGRGRTL